MSDEYDYIGRVTRNGIKRSDGYVFTKETFSGNDSLRVPVLRDHNYEDIFGHALLENREDGVYAKITFFNNVLGNTAKKLLLETNDYGLGFYANKIFISDVTNQVLNGNIRAIFITPKDSLYTYEESED